MVARVNFADPTFEPTDDDLVELAREAFGPVKDRNDRALARFNEQIEELREAALAATAEANEASSA